MALFANEACVHAYEQAVFTWLAALLGTSIFLTVTASDVGSTLAAASVFALFLQQ